MTQRLIYSVEDEDDDDVDRFVPTTYVLGVSRLGIVAHVSLPSPTTGEVMRTFSPDHNIIITTDRRPMHYLSTKRCAAIFELIRCV
jgi:hypothetical protein